MRILRKLCILTLLGSFGLGLTGCASWNKFRDPAPLLPEPDVNAPAPSSEALVNYLNRNASKLSIIDCKDLDIDAKAQGRSAPTVRGSMVCQKPRNFRLSGKVMAMPQIDAGSNPDGFWFWVKEVAPYTFHCSYNDFEKGVQMPFPFQPEWVVQALGMGEYGDPSKYRVEMKRESIDLVEDTVGPQGEKLRKITMFNRFNVAPPQSQVKGYVMQNARGDVICSAMIKEVRMVSIPGTGETLVYPRVVALDWPPEQMSMEMTLDRVQINQPLPEKQAARLFTRPERRDAPPYDLAKRPVGRPTARAEQPAGGLTSR